jgi:L,D-transpeptidase catalytic domain
MRFRTTCFGLVTAIGCLAACSQSPSSAAPQQQQANELHKDLGIDRLMAIPVPPEDGPKLAALTLAAPVYAAPEATSEKIGYLRIGAKVARSAEPVSRAGCANGWYAVRPVGFVCADSAATTDLDHPLVRAVNVEPNRAWPMPYRYAFVRAIAPNYTRVPSHDEQLNHEMRLDRHLRNWKKLRHEWDKLEVGANDVPLDASGLALGAIPDHATPLDDSQRFGGSGADTVPWWLEGGKRLIPNISTFQGAANGVMAGRIKRHAGVALIGTFLSGEKHNERRFAISVDARLLPADKLKADSGSPFHGSSLREVGLPVAFARKAGAMEWKLKDGELVQGERLQWREMVPLTGKSQRLGGVMVLQTRAGGWVRSDDVKSAKKPNQLPWYAKGDRRWIQVSLTSQTLVLWEGENPVYATLVSTGRDGLGDPKTTLSTPQGNFRILEKHVTHTMDSTAADSEFELRDVPWVMYFHGGYALHAAYWHDDFGRPRSHGCVNMSPIDARYVFEWSSPEVPAHWHGVDAGETFDKGTIVQIGP